ncbi:hypothetical protein B0H13DRAFT_2302503 [Mycena leptocephala]|nr:hypothetical protein B0H13DRAFT_2302503 [Mycena leptocephala]
MWSTGSQLQRIRGDASIVKVKPEPAEPIIRRKQIKQEHQSSPDLIIISDDDDDPVTLKQQHHRVEKTAQLAVDFYLGYYLFKLSFPGTEEKNAFARDALFNAAYTLGLADIMEKIRTDTAYCDLLAPLLHGRVITANYSLHGNTEGRVAFLITGMRYIYPLSPGPVDPRTGKRGDDVVDTTLPYMTAGIRSTLLHAFFKGSPSVASKYSQLFEINKQTGRKEVPAAMVALGGTAVHSSLNEYRTGRHRVSCRTEPPVPVVPIPPSSPPLPDSMTESKGMLKLTADNYEVWRILMEAVFTRKNVLDVAVGTTPRPTTGPNSKAVKDWDRKSAEARAEMILAVEIDQLAT